MRACRIVSMISIAGGASVLASASLAGQGSVSSPFDRTTLPKAGANPEFHLPKWNESRLSNGARLIVVERHALPLISFSMNLVGGANQFEPADKAGLGSITAGMMTEGTTTRTANEISDALQLLGTTVSYNVSGEGGTVTFRSLKNKFEPTLAIVVDEIAHPALADSALDRLKKRTIVDLRDNLDYTSGIAGDVYPRLLYGTDHPYGRTQTEESTNAITRADVVAFHDAFFRPSRAVITVVGDITLDEAKAKIERALGPWSAAASPVSFSYPSPPAAKATTIYIVDKPGAAQSTFSIGVVGPPRTSPDYFALRVMNTLFGGMFQSRINANIREAKGWSYGVFSNFNFGRGPGPFEAGGDIQTDKTDSALVEFLREIKGIRGDRPVTDDELAAGKAKLIQSLPSRLASLSGVSGLLNEIYVNELPQDYWTQFTNAVNKVTATDIQRVARQYIDLDHLTILIVGDRAKIEGPVKATGIAPVVVVDKKGNPL